ncbi:ArsR/SmtB family transcription factor [Galactobacter caseinivorans]|uniref:Transcriptional regulator n=1 Tax=Galactobacter caseinivorans TaxID=2676123 RepID=A0A496PLE3_9MICC|nr:metalloregulator ArsR/SmtB family transcription factor [Galactobacter caseinivorans]RKW71362.1 transcriptional regulator [Galactobacter caseinivorans]
MTALLNAAHAGGVSGAAAGACCAPAQGQDILTQAQAASLAAKFKALADPNRLKILSIVAAAQGHEACVCDIQEPLDLGQPTVSHHLKTLVDAGILRREKRGVWAYYSLLPGALESIAGALIPQEIA